MDDETTTSPPGSWPDGSDTQEISSDNGRHSGPEPQTAEDGGKRTCRSKEKEVTNSVKREAMLPSEIIEQILYLTDPETFASLVLVSSCWRKASQTPHLYAHHLSRCPSFSINNNVIAGPFTDNSLDRLKKQFNQEIKRNLFAAYLRPRQVAVTLTSTTTSSSASFPGGEAFEFSFSPNGHWTLALSSSRIYVLDTLSPQISVQRELKVLRRPLSAAILDDGSILAVLSSDHQVNVYDLSNLGLKYLRSLPLDSRPKTLAMSPKGEVLATAFDGGIEVHSLAANALSSDRRAVKCDSVDSIAFSSDGTMLLGTTQNSRSPSTVLLTAPYYSEGDQNLPANILLGQMWTSQIIFPSSSRDCSHATMLPHPTEGDSNWTFAYDRVFESFRAVRTDDMRNGTTYFTGPKPQSSSGTRAVKRKLNPSTLPATSDRGELVAAGFAGKDIWIYGVPENLDLTTLPKSEYQSSPGIVMAGSNASSNSGNHPGSPPTSLTTGESAELMRLPQWQVLVDKYRNVFAKGRRVAEVPGATNLRWVSRQHERLGEKSISERLIIAAPGGVPSTSGLEQDDFASVDGGRLVILDFDRTVEDGKLEQLNFEVGDAKPEMLEEGNMDMDTEVAFVRQRTVRKRRDVPNEPSVASMLASGSDVPPMPSIPPQSAPPNVPQAALSSQLSPTDGSNVPSRTANSSPSDGLTLEEASAAFDGPYSQTAPRSRTSLYRSATAVADHRQRNPPRIVESGQVAYRRADGRGELPHESDADNWVPPPPPYTAKSDIPLPEHLRMSILPRRIEPTDRVTHAFERPRRASTVSSPPLSATSSQRRVVSSPDRERQNPFRQRGDSTASPIRRPLRRTTSDTIPESTGTVSPISSVGMSFEAGANQFTSPASRGSPGSITRRPFSAFVGRYIGSHQRPSTARLTSPISPIPEPLVPPPRSAGNSISLPASPVRPAFPELTLSGANLQSRLEYPLPPAPRNDPDYQPPAPPQNIPQTSNPHPQTPAPIPPSPNPNPNPSSVTLSPYLETLAASMPSAQQLANLNNRYNNNNDPSRSPSRLITSTSTSSTSQPRPPRAALGAAGSPISPARRRRQSLRLGSGSTFSASSPALLRPTARRLDTIHSVSSFLSRSGTRSRSRPGEDLRMARSRSVDPMRPPESGPIVPTTRIGTRKGRKKGKGKGAAGVKSGDLEFSGEAWGRVGEGEGERERGKCVLM
ncbi:MAG: hypothetical protein HETSPECPRED_001239 [Heterodermia speciosa]|uniref:DUF7165 domain-containing protein n=1 Tax=Heterodermia speciosa TaxID=116794 RepID=A0A8H3IEF7_9LECA|nr:MAG: hypothetical protein HETSPECPRED_001239 [Heterodermia speciosa]